MQTLKYKRFTRRAVLKRIARPLLAQFLERFRADFNAQSLALPPPELSDVEYMEAWARLLRKPEHLPDTMNEVLAALEELAAPKAFESVELCPEWPLLQRMVKADSTREEMLLQFWLPNPVVLARLHNSQRFKRLTLFEHAGSLVPAERRVPFDPNDKLAIANLSISLDAWFLQNSRGSETTRIEVYPMNGEFWFLIRHGDIYTRAPKVEGQSTEVLHFRPERDDVVVYAPALDELRVNARTKGERDLYIQQFGLHLRGQTDYFANRATYTLEPLRTEGADALDAREVEGIEAVRLRELEVSSADRQHTVTTEARQGLFEFAAAVPDGPAPIPNDGWLQRAVFEIQFTGSTRAHPVEIRLPNILKISRACDSQLVHEWLLQSPFRISRVAGESMQCPVSSVQ